MADKKLPGSRNTLCCIFKCQASKVIWQRAATPPVRHRLTFAQDDMPILQ